MTTHYYISCLQLLTRKTILILCLLFSTSFISKAQGERTHWGRMRLGISVFPFAGYSFGYVNTSYLSDISQPTRISFKKQYSIKGFSILRVEPTYFITDKLSVALQGHVSFITNHAILVPTGLGLFSLPRHLSFQPAAHLLAYTDYYFITHTTENLSTFSVSAGLGWGMYAQSKYDVIDDQGRRAAHKSGFCLAPRLRFHIGKIAAMISYETVLRKRIYDNLTISAMFYIGGNDQ